MTRNINDHWEVSKDAPPQTIEGAVRFMVDWLTQTEGKDDTGLSRQMIDIVTEMIKKEPSEWWAGHHFGWGMSMRNLLRKNGFSEKEIGVDNLDDYYIPIIEEACLGPGKNIRLYPQQS